MVVATSPSLKPSASTASLPEQVEDVKVAVIKSPLRHLDPNDIDRRVRRELRNREVHLPPVSTYRWWARRSESVNGAILDAISHDRPGKLAVGDPFAGGGVIPLAAVMRGHSVYAQDLNPWAAAGLAAMLAIPDPADLRDAIAALAQRVLPEAAAAYGTTLSDGTKGQVSHTFRVAVASCTRCGESARLFPHALVSLLRRVERDQPEAFLACPRGHIFEGRRDQVSECPTCSATTDPDAVYTPRRVVTCPCGHHERLEARAATGLNWEVVLVERVGGKRRELGLPTAGELAAADDRRWRPTRDLGPIPVGQETAVLRRHGFRDWQDLYPQRQRAFIERLLSVVDECSQDESVVNALKLAVIGSTEMAGHLSRWDRYYLKSYESMAGHRFNFTTFSAEPNAWGSMTSGRGTTLRRLMQMVKASEWMHSRVGRRLQVEGPIASSSAVVQSLIAEDVDELPVQRPDVLVVVGSSQRQLLPSGTLDVVLTDPPYHDDVHYGELSKPFQAWSGWANSDSAGDAVVNRVTGQLTESGSYEALLASIFRESARLLREDGHLIFSFANRDPAVWAQLLNALQHAGLRAVGSSVLHSENETDSTKRGVRACTLDLILDLVPISSRVLQQYRAETGSTDEHQYLSVVADAVSRIGDLKAGWESEFIGLASESTFLRPPV